MTGVPPQCQSLQSRFGPVLPDPGCKDSLDTLFFIKNQQLIKLVQKEIGADGKQNQKEVFLTKKGVDMPAI
jgi:hypothetical protein